MWHGTRRLIAAVSAALMRQPEPPPASVVAAAAEEEGKGRPLKFVSGQMLLLRGGEAGGGVAGEATRPPTALAGDSAGGDVADDDAVDGRGAGGGADFCLPLLCEGVGACRLVDGAASGSAEEPDYEELSYDELYHGRAIGAATPQAAAAASFAQRLSRRLETRGQRVSLQAIQLERAGAEQSRAAALKRGGSPESAEALTWERKIAELQISELEKTLSQLKLSDEPSQGGDEERRQRLLREGAAAEKRMVEVLARARRAARSREEDAARTLLELQEEEAEEGKRGKGSREANAARRAAMPEREANAEEARHPSPHPHPHPPPHPSPSPLTSHLSPSSSPFTLPLPLPLTLTRRAARVSSSGRCR